VRPFGQPKWVATLKGRKDIGYNFGAYCLRRISVSSQSEGHTRCTTEGQRDIELLPIDLQTAGGANRMTMYQTNSTNVETDHAMTRRRISKACNYCRQRKIKCNGTSPCTNCQNHGIDCIYTKTIRKKKRPMVKKLTMNELEKRVNKLDEKVDTMNEALLSILQILKKNKLADSKLSQDLDASMNDLSSEEDQSEDEELNTQFSSPLSDHSSLQNHEEDNNVLTPQDNEFPLLQDTHFVPLDVQGLGSQFTMNSASEQLDITEDKLAMGFFSISQMHQDAALF
jgi:hypothetical protein